MIRLVEKHKGKGVDLNNQTEVIEMVVRQLTLWHDCEEDYKVRLCISSNMDVLEHIKKLIQEV